MKRNTLSVTAGAIALATVLAACGGGGGETGGEAGGGEGDLAFRWAHQPGNPADTPLLVAEEVGLLEDEGITVEKLGVTGGNANQVAAVASGNADFYFGTVDALSTAVDQGQDVRAFCGLVPETPLPLLARPEAGLETFEENNGNWEDTVGQFRGLKLGVPARGSSYELKTSAILESGGVQPDEVTYVPVGVGPAVLAAIDAGQIDALLAYPFLPEQLEVAGTMEQIVDANVDGPASLVGQQSTVIIATNEWIEENGDKASTLCSTVDTINEAIMDPANEAAVKSVLEANSGVSGETLEQAYTFVTDDYYGSEITEERMNKAIDLLVAAGTVPEGAVSYDGLVQKPE